MKRLERKRNNLLTVVLLALLSTFALTFDMPTASAATITSVLATAGNSGVNQTTGYSITMTTSNTAIACVSVTFGSLSNGTGPSPVTLSSSTDTPSGNFMNWTGWTGSHGLVSGGNGAVYERWIKTAGTSAPATTTNGVLSLASLTNSAAPGVSYAKVETFTNNDCTTGATDSGNAPVVITDTSAATNVFGQNGSFTTGGNGLTASTLNFPFGSAVDGIHHRFFLAERNNTRVLVFNLNADNSIPDTTADNVIGQNNFTSNGSATSQSGFNLPQSVAYDSVNNRLYVSDYLNNRVMVFNVASITNGMNASYVIGQPDFTSTGGTGSAQSSMGGPQGLAIDSAGKYLYVTDPSNNRVLVYDTSSLASGMNAAYVLGQTNFTNNGWAFTQTTLRAPPGVAVDPSNGRVYVADQGNNRIMIFDGNSLSNGMNASLVLGQTNFTSTGIGTSQDKTSSAQGIAAAGNWLAVADNNNQRVLLYDRNNLFNGANAIGEFGQGNFSTASSGTTSTSFNLPLAVSMDPLGSRLYVSDRFNNRVLVFNLMNLSAASTVTTTVDPSMTFTVAGRASVCNNQPATNFQTGATATAVGLGHITSATVSGGAQDLSIATNSANGFNVYIRTSGTTPNSLRDSNSHSIADVSGTNASPGSVPVAGTAGFGYTSDDTSTPFTSNMWAKLTNTNDAVLIGSPGTGSKSACLGYEVAVATTTPAGNYTSTIVYSAIPNF